MEYGHAIFHGTLKQVSNAGVQVGAGTTAQRPSNAAGLIRYNTDLSRFETNNGSAWANIASADGTVTSVSLTGITNAITVSGSPITGSGTFALALAGELAGINAVASNGILARTAAGTYTPRTIAAASAAGTQGVTVTNGDGVSGAPTIGLSITGLSAAGALANTATFIVNDGTNNVKATLAQLLTLVDSGFVLQTGDTMTGSLTLNADPSSALHAATKSYVDNGVATATQIAGNGLTLTTKTFSVNTSNASVGTASGNLIVRSTATVGQVLTSTGTAGVEATWGALSLAQANSVTGVLPVANGGTGGANAAVARSNLGLPGVYRTSFTNANLTANALTVTHSLGQQFVQVQITDNNNRVIQPDEITMTSSSVSTVDFTSYGALTGTWNVVVVG